MQGPQSVRVWQLGTGTKLHWDRLRVPWLRDSQGDYSRKVWLVRAHPQARKVPGTQRPSPSRPTSLKGITYVQSYYRPGAWRAGKGGVCRPSSAATVSLLPVQRHPSAVLRFVEIRLCLLTELLMEGGKPASVRAGKLFSSHRIIYFTKRAIQWLLGHSPCAAINPIYLYLNFLITPNGNLLPHQAVPAQSLTTTNPLPDTVDLPLLDTAYVCK